MNHLNLAKAAASREGERRRSKMTENLRFHVMNPSNSPILTENLQFRAVSQGEDGVDRKPAALCEAALGKVREGHESAR